MALASYLNGCCSRGLLFGHHSPLCTCRRSNTRNNLNHRKRNSNHYPSLLFGILLLVKMNNNNPNPNQGHGQLTPAQITQLNYLASQGLNLGPQQVGQQGQQGQPAHAHNQVQAAGQWPSTMMPPPPSINAAPHPQGVLQQPFQGPQGLLANPPPPFAPFGQPMPPQIFNNAGLPQPPVHGQPAVPVAPIVPLAAPVMPPLPAVNLAPVQPALQPHIVAAAHAAIGVIQGPVSLQFSTRQIPPPAANPQGVAFPPGEIGVSWRPHRTRHEYYVCLRNGEYYRYDGYQHGCGFAGCTHGTRRCVREFWRPDHWQTHHGFAASATTHAHLMRFVQ